MSGLIAFQGLPGAYSDLACRNAYPGRGTLPCESFESAMEAVRSGKAELAMLPCENSLAGRVPDIHHMLPDSGLFVIGEAVDVTGWLGGYNFQWAWSSGFLAGTAAARLGRPTAPPADQGAMTTG